MNMYHVNESCGRGDRFAIDHMLGQVREGLRVHLHNQGGPSMRSRNSLFVNGYGMSYTGSWLVQPYMDVRSIELTLSVDRVPIEERNVFNSVWTTLLPIGGIHRSRAICRLPSYFPT